MRGDQEHSQTRTCSSLTETRSRRGPEIEHCIADEGTDPAVENDWSLLPFMALSDGAHL